MPFDYSIETAGSFAAAKATEDDIQRAFERDKERGEFIILNRSDGSFLQAAGTGAGPYVLEYAGPGAQEHIRAADELGKDQVRLAFLEFYRGESTWRSARQWESVKSGGCLSVLILCVLLFGLKYLA